MIKEPKHIKNLNKKQLDELAEDLRKEMINTVAKNGGHLAPSLGVVELTIALHYVFNSPKDKIIWDVGHQSYPHKLLTGRKDKFYTLRKHNGISGFPKRNESKHDIFGTGHSSTSISAALGIAKARDIKKQRFDVIAVIGDGALTGGMAFEALNHAGSLKTDLTVILNDNEMSISKNVGALSKYLSKIVTYPKYIDRKKWLLNTFGEKAAKAATNIEEIARALPGPGLLFKELGFNYFGPIDGHDIDALIKALNNIKQIKGPVLLHVLTKKGKGYSHAENNKTKFHGISPFDVENGNKFYCVDAISYTEAFSSALMKIASKNKDIVAITAAMASGTGLKDFQKVYPDRFFDVGIAEQHAVTLAAGLASQGLRPIVTIYSTFLQRAFDQILHDVALQNLPVIFAVDRAGLVGEDGPTHHGNFDLSYLRQIPNLTIMSPKDENELQHMLYTATKLNNPVALRYPRGCGLGVDIDTTLKSIKKAEILKSGKDITILAIGSMVAEAMKAYYMLKKKGIKAEIINARFIKHIDKKTIIDSVKKTKTLITIEENITNAGFGSAVDELIAENNIQCKIRNIGLPDKFIEHGKISQLRQKYGLTAENIVKVAKRLT
jgi:1-deoxy-D-xylulose-5-phosphate synthase